MPCVFCEIVAGRLPASRVHEDDRLIAFLDIFPWRPGHTLVLPKAHAVRLADLPDADVAALFALGQKVAAAQRAGAVPCDDVHFVVNDGPAAFQSVPHVHLHVLPRTRGDGARLFARLLRHPLMPLLGPTPRETLDAQARAIRERIAAG